jgi:surfactin synthase thioesterase subunit
VNAYDQWIICPAPRLRPRLRLFCLPFAGGNAGAFRALAERLPPWVQLCAVQLPGRQRRMHEPPFTKMEPLVDALEAALKPFFGAPFAILGNCTGSLIGFELARRHPPAHLFVSSCRAPQLPDEDPPLHALDEKRLRAELDRMGGTPPEVTAHPELLQLLLPVLRSDFEVAEGYLYREGPPLECSVTAFLGEDDAVVTPAQVDGWRAQTRGRFARETVGGDHYLLGSDGFARALAAALERDVA